MEKFVRLMQRLLRWQAPIRKATQEAAEQRLAKAAKLDTLFQQDLTDDHRDLAESDRAAVEKFRNEKMKWSPSNSQPTSKDSWVCDDMIINTGRSMILETLLILAFLALMAYAIVKFTAPPTVPSPSDSEYDVLFYDKDGNQITVPRKGET